MQTFDVWTDAATVVGRAREERARKKIKARETLCVTMPWGSRGSKNRFAKAAGAEVSGRMRDQLHIAVARSTISTLKCQNVVEHVHAILWCEALFRSHKTFRTHRFGS